VDYALAHGVQNALAVHATNYFSPLPFAGVDRAD
jgi:hypothetical protein